MEDSSPSDSVGEPPETLCASTADPPKAGPAFWRAEVDTSAPFQSVKEAVDKFGGSAVWRSQLKQLFHPEEHHPSGDVHLIGVEEQAALLEKDLIMKERETLDVLKELEMTKKIVDGLKRKLQKENVEVAKLVPISSDKIISPQKHDQADVEKLTGDNIASVESNQSARLIALELNQAKEKMSRTMSNLTAIRESIEVLNRKIEEEKHMIKKTHEKFNSNIAVITSLEVELNKTTEKLQKVQYLETKRREGPSHISQEIKKLNAEMEQSRQVAEAAKVEVVKLMVEIEQTKASIKTADIRITAAKRMEEAARAAEAVAVAEMKALMSSNNSSSDLHSVSSVTLATEEYVTLMLKAQEAEEISKRKIEAAMIEVNEANRSRAELLLKVEEANAESKAYKKVFEDALKREDDAKRGKIAVEEALRKWRSEHGQRRHNFNDTTKFKNYSIHRRRNSRLLDLNSLALITDDPPITGLHPPLSIGQILSMKSMIPQGDEREKSIEKPKVSLREMLSKKPGHGVTTPHQNDESACKTSASKRKKLGFVSLSLSLAKKNKNRKSQPHTTSASSSGKAKQEHEEGENHLNSRC